VHRDGHAAARAMGSVTPWACRNLETPRVHHQDTTGTTLKAPPSQGPTL